MRKTLTTCALLASACFTVPAFADQASDAKAFGSRNNVLGVSISPDGQNAVVLQPDSARGTLATVFKLDGSGDLKTVMTSSGDPDRLEGCSWVSNTRLVCTIYLITAVYGERMGATRMLAVNADGSDMKELSAKEKQDSLGAALTGGRLVDWQGGADDTVLMTRYVIPQMSTGKLSAETREGLGVEAVNTDTLRRKMVEAPNRLADTYISDGQGNVRVMGLSPNNSVGESTDQTMYRYRKKGERSWAPLTTTTYSNYQVTGFRPRRIDAAKNVVYGLERVDGHTGLYSMALDGSLSKAMVFQAPDGADVNGLITVGRDERVVGATWTTDKPHFKMFDPELNRLATSLGKALPSTPIIGIVDASADEQRLIVFANSDQNPGKFYLFDKSNKHLAEISPVRSQLGTTKLAAMTPIQLPVGDGTMIPAYLTLPPGSSGKNLPAIVMPHGGPSERDVWDFDWLVQFYAARGYAVIQPEYRGSTGYGDAFFGNNAIRDWKRAIGDVNDTGRWLVKQGIANPNKLAIVGWSYGGYAALQSQVLDPNLFKAVVAIAPVTDFGLIRRDYEASGSSTPQSLNAMFGNAQTAEEGSPARHVRDFKAPVMMFMGDVDQNVPVSQARLMKDRLQGAGKSVQYVEYRGLDHQLDDSKVRAEMLAKSDTFLRASMGM